jgi:hypothetical protein
VPQLESQGDLFPACSPESLSLYAERLRRRIVRLAPALSVEESAHVLGEVALVEGLLDRLEGFALLMSRGCSSPPSASPRRRALSGSCSEPPSMRFSAPAWAVRREDHRRPLPTLRS